MRNCGMLSLVTAFTVSREAAGWTNQVVLRNLFAGEQPLSNIPREQVTHTFPVYQNIPVIITQNRDKRADLLSVQRATILRAESDMILLRLPNGSVILTHPMTYINKSGEQQVTYLFNPSYAATICKSQGTTITKLLLWTDCAKVEYVKWRTSILSHV